MLFVWKGCQNILSLQSCHWAKCKTSGLTSSAQTRPKRRCLSTTHSTSEQLPARWRRHEHSVILQPLSWLLLYSQGRLKLGSNRVGDQQQISESLKQERIKVPKSRLKLSECCAESCAEMNTANLDDLKLRCKDEWTKTRPQRHGGHTETFTAANRASTSHWIMRCT